MVAITAAEEIPLATEARARLALPPRRPPTALGAAVVPPLPPRRRPPPRPSRPPRIAVYMVRRPTLLRTVATGVIIGAFAAITRLGPHPFALRGVVPILAAGGVSGVVMATVGRSMPRLSKALFYVWLTVAGCAGGMVWWLLVHPSSSLLIAMWLGALLAQTIVAFEAWLRQAAGLTSA
jgi:hypothetical protein